MRCDFTQFSLFSFFTHANRMRNSSACVRACVCRRACVRVFLFLFFFLLDSATWPIDVYSRTNERVSTRRLNISDRRSFNCAAAKEREKNTTKFNLQP